MGATAFSIVSGAVMGSDAGCEPGRLSMTIYSCTSKVGGSFVNDSVDGRRLVIVSRE
jgi:hypothetical protein